MIIYSLHYFKGFLINSCNHSFILLKAPRCRTMQKRPCGSDCSDLQGQFLRLDNYQGGWQNHLKLGYPALPFYNNLIMRSSQRLLPELLPDELPVHGTVSRKHNQDRSCCRTLQKTDLHHARHRYLHEGSD